MKYAFVTGSTRGIGLSIAKKILSDPDYVLLAHGKRDLGSQELSQIFGEDNINRVSYLKADLSRPQEIEKIKLGYEELDLFINNAGIYDSKSVEELVNINLTSSIILVKKVYEAIGKRKGVIININSLAGIFPNFKESVYCATKFGLDGYFKSLQSECHKDGVAIGQYYLGATQSDMTSARLDYDLLIDPEELSELILSGLKNKSLISVGQIIKRKKY